jgi:hypothetical protein
MHEFLFFSLCATFLTNLIILCKIINYYEKLLLLLLLFNVIYPVVISFFWEETETDLLIRFKEKDTLQTVSLYTMNYSIQLLSSNPC